MTCQYANLKKQRCDIEEYRYNIEEIGTTITEQGLIPGCRGCSYLPQFMIEANKEHKRMKELKKKDIIAEEKIRREKVKRPLEPKIGDILIYEDEETYNIQVSKRLQKEFDDRAMTTEERLIIISDLIVKTVKDSYEHRHEATVKEDVIWM